MYKKKLLSHRLSYLLALLPLAFPVMSLKVHWISSSFGLTSRAGAGAVRPAFVCAVAEHLFKEDRPVQTSGWAGGLAESSDLPALLN